MAKAETETEVDVQAKVEEAVQRIRGAGTQTRPPRTMVAAKAAIASGAGSRAGAGSKRGGDAGALTYTTYEHVVYLSCPCGWCMTGDHSGCKPTLIWNNTLYVCGCGRDQCVKAILAGVPEDATSVVRDAVESKSKPKAKKAKDADSDE